MKSGIRLTKEDRGFHVFINASLIAILTLLFVPIWSTITLSFRPNDFIGSALDGMLLVPWKWSTAAYQALLGHRAFINSAINSFRIFFEGVGAALFLTVPLAYMLSIKSLPGKIGRAHV